MRLPPILHRGYFMRWRRLPGESLRDLELRWQAKTDHAIRAHIDSGASKAYVASRAGVSKTAIINSLRRSRG